MGRREYRADPYFLPVSFGSWFDIQLLGERRQILGVEMANRESSTSWKDFLLVLKGRGLGGVILAVSDDHPGSSERSWKLIKGVRKRPPGGESQE